MARLRYRQRQKDGHRKFLLGLAFERTGLAFLGKTYITSEYALTLCHTVVENMQAIADTEHRYYQIGESAFNSKTFSENKTGIEQAKRYLGKKWKQERYHNLVRLGADIARSPLADSPKATILGGFICLASLKKKTVNVHKPAR